MNTQTQILCIGSVLWDVIGRSASHMRQGSDVPGRITRLPFVINPVTWMRGYSYREGDEIPLKVQQSAVRRVLRKARLNFPALSTPLHPDTSWRLVRGGNMSYVTAVKPR